MGLFSCRRKSSAHVHDSHRPPLRVFDHGDLALSPSSLLGRGSHSSVYLTPLDGGRLLAAAKLPSPPSEIRLLSSLPYSPHLVNLLGHTLGPPSISVLELMPNGSLHSLLHDPSSSPPPFPLRLRLAAQLASAVASLHALDPPVVHRDIKPSNVLLDGRGNARLADFGLAVRLPAGGGVAPAGTMGYIDPAYVMASGVGTERDVYSFGVVLFEVLSGRRAIDVGRSPAAVVKWAEGLVAAGRGEEVAWEWGRDGELGWGQEAREAAEVAGRCVGPRAEERPGMGEVAATLWGVERRVAGRGRGTRGPRGTA